MTLRSTGLRVLGVLLVTYMLACGDDSDSDETEGLQEDGGATDDGGAGTNGGGDSPCELGCEATLRADCTMGPSSRQVCESDCERLRAGECGTEYRALMSCGEAEDVTCDSSGRPVVEGCAAEQSAFVTCIN